LRFLDLFSGIGAFALGLERAGMTVAAFCEIDPFCQLVLRKHWPHVPIFNDVCELTRDKLIKTGVIDDEIGQTIDLICGGFPCQPFSIAGKRKGAADSRYLWPEMFRIIKALRPRWVLGENVAGIVNLALDTVLSDLESEGYETATFIIPACAVGAPHKRDRVWIVAHSNSTGLEIGTGVSKNTATECKAIKRAYRRDTQSRVGGVFDGSVDWLHGDLNEIISRIDSYLWPAPFPCDQYMWEPPRWLEVKPPNHKQRIIALGNSLVPQIAEVIGYMILQVESITYRE
jgi:DNA (cytosine-5)-methyltransferase 1